MERLVRQGFLDKYIAWWRRSNSRDKDTRKNNEKATIKEDKHLRQVMKKSLETGNHKISKA